MRRMKCVVQRTFGGPEVLTVTESAVPIPSDEQCLIQVTLSGVNFADLMGRQTGNNYISAAQLPIVPGAEVVGIEALTGRRVAAICGFGGYAEWVIAPKAQTFAIPDDVEDRTALALMVQGLTAWFLYHTARPRKGAGSVVVHGAAGGVGCLALQLGRLLGFSRVIATGSTEAKREIARQLGANEAIGSETTNLARRLVEANGGRLVDLIFDRSGGEVFTQSFDALAPFGEIVVYGTSSGSANDVNTRQLISGTRSVSGMWIKDYLRDPPRIAEALDSLFRWAASSQLKPVFGATYPLDQAPQAHRDLAERLTVGKLFLDASA